MLEYFRQQDGARPFPGKLHRDRNNNNIIQLVFYTEVTTHNHSRITILHKDDVLLLFIIIIIIIKATRHDRVGDRLKNGKK